MDEPLVQSFAKVADELRLYIEGNTVLPDPEAGFSLFVGQTNRLSNAAVNPLPGWPAGTGLKHPQELACFGYLVALSGDYGQAMQDDWKTSLGANLTRDLFPIDRQSFTYRPVEVLGLAVGVNALIGQHDRLRSDFADVVRQCRERGCTDATSSWMYWLAESTLSTATPSPPRIDENNLPINVAALIYWIVSGPDSL